MTYLTVKLLKKLISFFLGLGTDSKFKLQPDCNISSHSFVSRTAIIEVTDIAVYRVSHILPHW